MTAQDDTNTEPGQETELRNRVAELEAKMHYARLQPKIVGLIFFACIAAIVYFFSPLGDLIGYNKTWFDGSSEIHSTALIAATRNLITVLGPLFIGVAIWLISNVAEKRLKFYDEEIRLTQEKLDSRFEAFRAEIRQRSRESETKLDNFSVSLSSRIDDSQQQQSKALTDARRDIQTSIEANIDSKIEGLVGKFVEEGQGQLSISLTDFKDQAKGILQETQLIQESISSRFGHIAEATATSETVKEFGAITSVGAVHSKVTELNQEDKRSDAVLLVKELLARFADSPQNERPSGALNDWFNLSAQLGKMDEEAIALQVCLAGLEQQSGNRILDEKNNAIWENQEIVPNDDLLAHAVQYAQTINHPSLSSLIDVLGYNRETNSGQDTWGWRSYVFSIPALQSLGRTAEAIELGRNFIASRNVSNQVSHDANSQKVVRVLAGALYDSGQHNEAMQLAEKWLKDNPDLPSAQIVTQLLSWGEGTYSTDRIVALVNRGLRDLAEEQPSTTTGNLYYRRALARDFDVNNRLLQNDEIDEEFVRSAIHASKDYKRAIESDLTLGLKGQAMNRLNVLKDILEPILQRTTHEE